MPQRDIWRTGVQVGILAVDHAGLSQVEHAVVLEGVLAVVSKVKHAGVHAVEHAADEESTWQASGQWSRQSS